MVETKEQMIEKVRQADTLLAEARLIMQRLDENAYKSESFFFLRAASDNIEKFLDVLKKEG